MGPGGGGDGSAADQDFAVGAELDLAAGHRLADGAAGDVEGMVEGDQSGGLRHAVTLDEDEAEGVPELFEGAGQRAAA
jgi:hypothetical protein